MTKGMYIIKTPVNNIYGGMIIKLKVKRNNMS